jgi:hypothetical protein
MSPVKCLNQFKTLAAFLNLNGPEGISAKAEKERKQKKKYPNFYATCS